MPLDTLLKADLVFAKKDIVSKKRALENLACIVADRLHCEESAVYDALLSREKLGSTGIGSGLAIPHCRLDTANRSAIVVMSLQEAIDFDSIDRKPVDLIFALIAPPHECNHHLATLAQIAELAQSPEALDKLRGAQDDEALYMTFKSLL
ncbi:PTS sugar transporter subunit IIA [Marinomonas epiphytica]